MSASTMGTLKFARTVHYIHGKHTASRGDDNKRQGPWGPLLGRTLEERGQLARLDRALGLKIAAHFMFFLDNRSIQVGAMWNGDKDNDLP